MKELELATLKEFNRIAKQNFIPEQNQYSRFDAKNKNYIMEIKCRKTHYEDQLIEFDKFSYNLLYAKFNKIDFLYLVNSEKQLNVFNISKMYKNNYNFRWHWREMPKTTEFDNKYNLLKYVGYVHLLNSHRLK